MELWVCLSLGSLGLFASIAMCEKWSQQQGIPIADFVMGRTTFQLLVLAGIWAWMVWGGSSSWTRLFTVSTNNHNPTTSPLSPRQHCARLFGAPQIVSGTLLMVLGFTSVAAIQRAPNPGYAAGIMAAYVLLLAVLAPALFRQSNGERITLSGQGVAGILLVIAGVVLLGGCRR